MLGGMRQRAVRALDRVERWLESEDEPGESTAPVWNAPTRAQASAPAVPEPIVASSAPPATPESPVVVAVEAAQPKAKVPPATHTEPTAAEATEPQAISLEALEQVLDDLVRPALQADGGDISVVKIESNNIHVRLTGACSTCPSAIMTLRMGVERLLREEFPMMRELIEVDAGI